MEKYRLIGLGLVLGTVIAAIVFFLGITYISGIITVIISIVIANLLIFSYFLIKYNKKRNTEVNKHEKEIKKIANDIKSIIPAINDEHSLKELISTSIKSIRNIYTSAFLLSTFFSLSMVLVGLLASAIAIKQNDTMRDQNYLICQQNNYLAFNKKFETTDPNEEIYSYFSRLKSLIRKILPETKEFSYLPTIDSDIRNQEYKKYLPQKEYTHILSLRNKVVAFENNGQRDQRNDPNFISLIGEYKRSLKNLYNLIINKESQMKHKKKEERDSFVKNNEESCKNYNN